MPAVAYRPHDLLWVPADSLRFPAGWPAWADADWLFHAPVVVRRERTVAALLPVGLRGRARSERSLAYLPRAAVRRSVTPEMLAAAVRTGSADSAGLAVLQALRASVAALDATGLAWGPTGGAGFFLATGLPVLRPDSDLDLVVRAPAPLARAQRAALEEIQRQAACRIDIQIDTGRGAFALAEWTRDAGRVLLKTGDGPLLCTHPWQPETRA
ncbi:MAG TPA: malonate decarboxylase holo-ACP synthase [Burkholderiaceae bacterium]|nr:malonate decarboxylase holo-ACP synthase [Burkholderiaceae bacterium]